MSSATLISVDEFLKSAYKPACEYIDGVLRPKPMPTKLHALIQFLIVSLLRAQNVDALAEVCVRVTPTKFFVPDVIADSRIQDPYPTEPVILCVEILSPDDEPGETMARVSDYLHAGTSAVWMIDPYKRRVFVADHNGTREVENLIVSMDLIGSVDFNELFRQLDEPAD